MRQGTPLDVKPGDYLALKQENRFQRCLPYLFLEVVRLTATQIICCRERADGSASPASEHRFYRDGRPVGGTTWHSAELRTDTHIMLQHSTRKRLSLDRDLRWLADHPTSLDSDPIDMLEPLIQQVRLTRARAEARMQINEAKGAGT